jgi:hypothetical protein
VSVGEVTAGLRTLALEARAAVELATAATRDADASRTLISLRRDVDAYPGLLQKAAFCLRSADLTLTDEELDEMASALRGALNALDAVASKLADDRRDVRNDQRWKGFKDAMSRVADASRSVRDAAASRLIVDLPAPEQGLIALLVPGDERREDYRRLAEAYDEARADITSDADVHRLRNVCERLKTLGAEIARTGVPEQHRAEWVALLGGTLTVEALTPAFADWLKAEGHAGSVVLVLR